MKTEISTFCTELGEVLSPFHRTLQQTIEEIRGKPESKALKHPLSGLADVHHRMKALVDKVEQQQAYVIIFGPLKSGKSTLMNAISSAYVSEVTSLPAYPCLVYVKHSEERRYQSTSYNGKKETTTDGAYMQRMVRDGHQTLAERIRQIEEEDEAFDPGVHYPDAIRRIDVEVPAKNLKDSLTVLVDTPGLYSKMKFGYDLMTREFRNSAACAVFVVKTDNLFLEQVFAEFNDLLDLFSRIFLVVNIDANKQDLGPDGALRPSLESENPDRIIRAFESLAMSAPLRRAADEGRLRIYPIDLLSAASSSLREGEEEAGEEDGGDEAAGGEDSAGEGEVTTATGSAPKPRLLEPFSEFLTDLTDYLNSSDYLLEFMGDSLRQGATLTEDIKRFCSEDALWQFYQEKIGLEGEIKKEKERLAAVERLSELEWEKAFDDLRARNGKEAEGFSNRLRSEIQGSLTDAIEQWFDSDESLQDLQESHFNSVLGRQEGRIHDDACERVRSLTGGSLGGMQLDAESLRALDRLELAVDPILRESLESVMEEAGKPSSCTIHISSDKIPVKKGFWDWLLFRGQSAVRRRLFGPNGEPAQPIPVPLKRKRLGEPAREAISTVLDTHLQKLFPDLPREYSDQFLADYAKRFSEKVREEVDAIKAELSGKLPDLEKRLKANKEVQILLERLKDFAVEVQESVSELKERHGNAVGLAEGNEGGADEGGGEEEDNGDDSWDGEDRQAG